MRVRRIHLKGGPAARLGSSLSLSVILLLAVSVSNPRLEPCLSRARAAPRANFDGGRAEGRDAGNIKELVPDKYLKRYLRWKSDYLSTEAGRRQWERYAKDENFALTIEVTPELGRGGVVDGYRWDEKGKLVAATITLGNGLDGGLLSPLYYPVTSSLSLLDEPPPFSGDILAAAKLAHEFGHINRAAETDAALYQLQNSLTNSYAKIFKENGYDTKDPRLVELARRMGGTPAEIKREREHGAEAAALVFLQERMSRERGNGALFKKIRKSVKQYGRGHLQLP